MIRAIAPRELTFYELLDVSPRASDRQLRDLLEAELYLVDEERLHDAPAPVRRVARDRRLRLQAARAVLTNPAARRKYDHSIALPPTPPPARVRHIPNRAGSAAMPAVPPGSGQLAAIGDPLRRARYASTCPSCSEPIERGELIGPITGPGGDPAWVCATCYHTEQTYRQG